VLHSRHTSETKVDSMAGIPNTRSFLVFLLLGAVFPIFTAAQRPADSDGAQLLTALRRFDVTEVRRLVAAGVDTHVKDEPAPAR